MVRSAGSQVLEYVAGRGVETAAGGILRDCMQCGTCTAVCPLIEYMEYSPRVLNALLLAGSYDDVLRSRAIWVCASCYACTVACPKQFPITDSIYALKRAAMRSGVYPRRFPTPVMTRRFVGMVGRRGRSSEFWISMSLYLRTQPAKLLRQAPMALGLLRRGRLRVRAESLHRPARLRAMLKSLETPVEGRG